MKGEQNTGQREKLYWGCRSNGRIMKVRNSILLRSNQENMGQEA
jgi:hypothetical protein